MPVSTLDDSPFGINCHVARDEMLDSLADIGIRWFRFDLEWSTTQPAPDRFDWSVPDRIVGWAKRRGVCVLAVVAYAPEWAWAPGERRKDAGDKGQIPTDSTDWVRFVEAAVHRYGARIEAYSLWNEPNVPRFWHGSKETYIDSILLPGIRAARSLDPTLAIAGPDLSSTGNPLREWLGPILDSGAAFDLLTHHQYDGGNTVRGRIDALDELQRFRTERGYPDVSLWLTEIGFRVPSETEDRETQAADLESVIEAMWTRPWWAKTFWYDSHGDGWGLFDGEAMRQCPSYAGYARVVQALKLGRARIQRAAQVLLERKLSEPEERQWASRARRSARPAIAQIIELEPFRTHRASLSADDLCLLLYRGILEREPDESGRAATLEAIAQGRLVDRIAAMLDSDEFTDSVS